MKYFFELRFKSNNKIITNGICYSIHEILGNILKINVLNYKFMCDIIINKPNMNNFLFYIKQTYNFKIKII